jgi:hypothetical protein
MPSIAQVHLPRPAELPAQERRADHPELVLRVQLNCQRRHGRPAPVSQCISLACGGGYLIGEGRQRFLSAWWVQAFACLASRVTIRNLLAKDEWRLPCQP